MAYAVNRCARLLAPAVSACAPRARPSCGGGARRRGGPSAVACTPFVRARGDDLLARRARQTSHAWRGPPIACCLRSLQLALELASCSHLTALLMWPWCLGSGHHSFDGGFHASTRHLSLRRLRRAPQGDPACSTSFCKRCRLREILEFCLLVSIPMIGLAIIVAYTPDRAALNDRGPRRKPGPSFSSHPRPQERSRKISWRGFSVRTWNRARRDGHELALRVRSARPSRPP